MKKQRPTRECEPERWYHSPDIPLRVIRRFARQLAEKFDPDKIILFGSYAYGTPRADSDVDILVVMPARNELRQAARIQLTLDPPFPVDILVQTPKGLAWRLKEGDCFLREIVSGGKVLYEKAHRPLGAQSRGRFRHRPAHQPRQDPSA
jgi:predicted nucleotidyltransferase